MNIYENLYPWPYRIRCDSKLCGCEPHQHHHFPLVWLSRQWKSRSWVRGLPPRLQTEHLLEWVEIKPHVTSRPEHPPYGLNLNSTLMINVLRACDLFCWGCFFFATWKFHGFFMHVYLFARVCVCFGVQEMLSRHSVMARMRVKFPSLRLSQQSHQYGPICNRLSSPNMSSTQWCQTNRQCMRFLHLRQPSGRSENVCQMFGAGAIRLTSQ